MRKKILLFHQIRIISPDYETNAASLTQSGMSPVLVQQAGP
ncbi:MAG: hypothetical protein AB8G95_04755 [Anaerolineae bacterium]